MMQTETSLRCLRPRGSFSSLLYIFDLSDYDVPVTQDPTVVSKIICRHQSFTSSRDNAFSSSSFAGTPVNDTQTAVCSVALYDEHLAPTTTDRMDLPNGIILNTTNRKFTRKLDVANCDRL